MISQSNLGLMQSSVITQIASEEAIIQNVLSSNLDSAEKLIENLKSSTASAQQLAYLISAGAYVGRAVLNLSNAST
jgi:hypothetical protein